MATLAEEFIRGTKDRFGQNVVTDSHDYYDPGLIYMDLVSSPSIITAVNAGLFDETALDPYELAAAKVNIENNQDDRNNGAIL